MSALLISDTLAYRPDGTVSGVTRRTLEAYTTPSGAPRTETVETEIALSDVTTALGAAYAAFDAHNKALEAQIETERAAHADELKAMQVAAAASAGAQAKADVA